MKKILKSEDDNNEILSLFTHLDEEKIGKVFFTRIEPIFNESIESDWNFVELKRKQE